jgi:asparagine synthetase B (glutamine-hydrolysing)
MFGNLRSEDALLFEQLARITRDLKGSAALLERLLAEPRSAAAGIALEARQLTADAALHPDDDDVDVRAFTGFAMRLDATQYRELAIALDAATESVHEAVAHVESLGGTDAPQSLRALAHTLSLAAEALQRAVPFAGEGGDEVVRGGSEVQRLADLGKTIYFDGVTALFAGDPDVMHVLRWRGIYDKVWHGLESCARGATVLEQVARANA